MEIIDKRNLITNRLNKRFKTPIIKKYQPIAQTIGSYSSGYGNFSTASGMMSRAYSSMNGLGYSPVIDRVQRYAEYTSMDYCAELYAGLNIFSEDSTVKHIDGNVLHVITNNTKIKDELNHLYFNVLNLNFNLWQWTREMLKFGDNFHLLDLRVDSGIVGEIAINPFDFERVENILDTNNPVKFILNQNHDHEFSIWEVAHFRMLSNRDFYPYGTSILEPVRRYYRQLVMLEDSMMIYRIVRSPQRRVVYLDVAGLEAPAVEGFVNEMSNTLKNTAIDMDSDGNMDYRLNPLSMLDDYIIPVRGKDHATKIETLEGAKNEMDMGDIKYIQKKLVTALTIPQRYLGLDDDQKSDLKNAAAQEDIRFSRTIERVQSMIIAELKRIGIIHLIVRGFNEDEIDEFEIQMKNPSSASEVEKLEVLKQKFGIAAEILEGKLADRSWVYENILNFTKDEIEAFDNGLARDYEFMAKLDSYSTIWSEYFKQRASKEFNVELPQDALGGGAGGGAGQNKDVAGDFRAKQIGGDNHVGNRLLAQPSSTTVLRPYESKKVWKFSMITDDFNKEVNKKLNNLLLENNKILSDTENYLSNVSNLVE